MKGELAQAAASAGLISFTDCLVDDSPAMRVGLRLLQQAYDYSRDLQRIVWDFAVEIDVLRRAGLNNNDLRWLHYKGYIEHGREITEPGDIDRNFQRRDDLTLTPESCFVLTEDGAHVLGIAGRRQVLASQGETNGHFPVVRAVETDEPDSLVPRWDSDLREFQYGGSIVKRFRTPSPNQETILAAFEEEGWPTRIDDPLPGAPEIDPKQRLHDTIKSLNRNQLDRRVRFRGDGTGEGVRWEPIDGK